MTIQRDPEGNELKQLRQMVEISGRRVLEIGSGDGRLTWKYAGLARDVVALELERDDLLIARVECPVALRRQVVFIRGDSIHLPFRGAAFDVALLSWSL
jgi:ubiquinone/menaquinone biosynthesis C-methylase UbiE